MSNILSIENFNEYVFKSPLYTKMKLPSNLSPFLDMFIIGHGVNLYCPDCGEICTFQYCEEERTKPNYISIHIKGDVGRSHKDFENFRSIIENLEYNCAKNGFHKMRFNFHVNEQTGEIIKYGQFPQLIEIVYPDKNKYDKLLKKYAIEYKTSLQVVSRGTGIGSFVYLRRIIQFLVEETHNELKDKQDDWDEERYNSLKHFNEKVEMCEKYVEIFPKELNQYKSKIWGILSKGIHELDEDECLNLFPALQYLIEKILDNKIAKKTNEEKLKSVESIMSSIRS